MEEAGGVALYTTIDRRRALGLEICMLHIRLAAWVMH